MPSISIVWFRQDLRLADQPALAAAAARGAVVPIFIDSAVEEGEWAAGAASRWWRHESLQRLAESLEALGSKLVIARGPALRTLEQIIASTGADAVYWTRRYEPAVIARDAAVKESLRARGIDAQSFNGALLIEPWEIRNRSGKPFQVFTPYWKEASKHIDPPAEAQLTSQLEAPPHWPESLSIEALGGLPRIPWHESIASRWTPGEDGAHRELNRFLDEGLFTYREDRDLPAVVGNSRLSPHLHFGEISPQHVWRAVARTAEAKSIPASEWRAWTFLVELVWREFAHHLLFHFPHTPLEPLRTEFRGFPWRDDAHALHAWQRGMTGIPLVDAGMRELWATGWMHNRVRMIVASFLVKNLRLPWQTGARWFWDTLVDADLANNTLGWQWTAGCGADAAPYFRVFNPVTQGERFDPEGHYVRRWVPEIATLPTQFVHAPWTTPELLLKQLGMEIGRTYPAPIVDLKTSREDALSAYRGMRQSSPRKT